MLIIKIIKFLVLRKMRNINMYSYEDKPFIVYRKNEIYKLNDPGFEKYTSNESHNVNYLKLSNPKVYRHVFDMSDPFIPEGMKKDAERVRAHCRYEFASTGDFYSKEESKKNKKKNPVKIIVDHPPKKENEQKEMESLQPPEKCLTSVKEASTKRIFSQPKRNLPPINVSQSFSLKNLRRRNRRRKVVIENEDNRELKHSVVLTSPQPIRKKKLTLPEIMKTSIDFMPQITTIRIGNSKEFGPKYCPFSSYIKTGDYIGTNVYGAKFNH